ncbi:hypothetical protein H4R18_002218 [Coemansia javaensis]|uniref:Cap-specific mRNA (nucleoside-2'-O-)-methyltransferase 1 n=1 Tax=Coemansia javaensis TaxID=2761396 RepID=A0A9W8HHC5_9FUNG|nr:hypothetical protein H4R18_002218 [Coemansia javaensis]
MPFDATEELFAETDPGYRSTLLDSGIAPPSLDTVPHTSRDARGRGRGQQRNYGRNQYDRQQQAQYHTTQQSYAQHGHVQHHAQQQAWHHHRAQQSHPQQSHLQQSHHNHYNAPEGSAGPRKLVRTDSLVRAWEPVAQVARARGPEFVGELAGDKWARMMSDKDDPRGRQADPRLCDTRLLAAIHAHKGALDRLVPELREAVLRAADPHAAVVPRCTLNNAAAIALGVVDAAVHSVQSRLRPGSTLHYVDLGSAAGGSAGYIRWRAAQRIDGARAAGWYFAPGTPGAGPAAAPADGLEVFEPDSSLLNPASIDAFAARLAAGEARGKVDLVVAGCTPEHSGLAADLEKHQYPFAIAQAALALRVLRAGGTLVLKMYEVSTPLTAGLLFLVHSCFERMAIVRPFSSPRASSERHFVFSGLAADPDWVARHLAAALAKMRAGQLKPSHLVSWTNVSAEEAFIEAIQRSGAAIATEQLGTIQPALAHAGQAAIARDAGFSAAQIEAADRCLRSCDLPVASAP